MNDIVTLALPKGRLFDPSIALLARAGCRLSAGDFDDRRLFVDDPSTEVRFVATKPWDVPIYVEYGVADLGVVGGDVLRERPVDVLVPLALPFGACRMVVAARNGAAPPEQGSTVRVASKYPRIAAEWFNGRGIPVEMIALAGSVELAPVLGLADRIVDLVETGRTLAANGLAVEAEVERFQARLIVCRSSLITRTDRVSALIDRIRDAAAAKDGSP